MTLSDTAWLALIVAIPPTITALGAIAISLYNAHISSQAAASLRQVAKDLVDAAAIVADYKSRERDRDQGGRIQEFP